MYIADSKAEEVITLEKIQVEENAGTLEERRDHSLAKRIINGQELTQYSDLNAMEILKRTPGVSIPDPKQKGSVGKGYTTVLIDGEEASPASKRRGNPLEQISSDMIERIEVMTNGSAEYTAESMGGIVNIVLKKPKAQGLTTAKIVGGAYGGDVPMASLFLQREGKNGNLAYLFNLNAADNQEKDSSSTSKVGVDYEVRDNTIRNQSFGIGTKIIYTPSSKDKYTFDGSVTKNENRSNTDTNSTTRLLNNYEKSHSTMLWAAIKGEHHLSGTELLDWKVKFHENNDNANSGAVQSLPTANVSLQNDKSSSRVLGTEGSYSQARGDHFIKAGAELKGSTQRDEVQRDVNGTNSGEQISLHQTKGALYVQDEISFGESMVITPGIRYESIARTYGATGHIAYFAPSLHMLLRISPEDNLRASVAKTVKLPRLDQLSTSYDSTFERNDIRHPDTTGNANLTEEKALSYELRLEHFFEDKGIASISSFYRTIDDKIESVTQFDSNTSRYVQRPSNVGEGNFWGIELEVKKSLGSLVDGLGMYANATFQDSSVTNSSTGFKRPIKQTNDYLYNIGVDHALKTYKLTYGAAYRYVSGYDDPIDENGISQVQKGYGTLDMYAIKRLNETFKMQLNWKNITGTTMETTSKTYSGATLTGTQINQDHSSSILLLSLEGKW
jgi:iron complex outermembrane receptor protein